MALRISLEREAVTRAAATKVNPRKLQDLLLAMSAKDITRAEFAALDSEFHLAVARAGGSELAAGVVDEVRGEVAAKLADVPDWPSTTKRLVAEHTRILAAISMGDPTWAAAEVDAHISAFYRLPAH